MNLLSHGRVGRLAQRTHLPVGCKGFPDIPSMGENKWESPINQVVKLFIYIYYKLYNLSTKSTTLALLHIPAALLLAKGSPALWKHWRAVPGVKLSKHWQPGLPMKKRLAAGSLRPSLAPSTCDRRSPKPTRASHQNIPLREASHPKSQNRWDDTDGSVHQVGSSYIQMANKVLSEHHGKKTNESTDWTPGPHWIYMTSLSLWSIRSWRSTVLLFSGLRTLTWPWGSTIFVDESLIEQCLPTATYIILYYFIILIIIVSYIVWKCIPRR